MSVCLSVAMYRLCTCSRLPTLLYLQKHSGGQLPPSLPSTLMQCLCILVVCPSVSLNRVPPASCLLPPASSPASWVLVNKYVSKLCFCLFVCVCVCALVDGTELNLI